MTTIRTSASNGTKPHLLDSYRDQANYKRAFDLCVQKSRSNIKRLADEPKAAPWAVDGNYFSHRENFFEIGNWTSSFFTGMALLAWRETEDEFFLNQVLRLAPLYREKVFTRYLDTHHDLGFLYSLYSVALYKLTGDEEHRVTGLRAAEVLAQRFNAKGNFIRAWGQMNTTEHNDSAIIDCLMNLPLLHWAATESSNTGLQDIAVRHADMCLKYFIRPDGSVNHAFRFDLKTGQPVGATNFCGLDNDSYWARGATWAIYGFALSYGYTRNPKYLETATLLAKNFIAQLDAEIVPIWDFRAPKNGAPLRDASAAAVMVCAIQELAKHNAADASLLQIKTALLDRICREDYLDFTDDCSGVQKHGQIGDGVGKARKSYTSWGDYFLMEALSRELGCGTSWW